MTPHFSNAELACRCGCGLLPPLDFMSKVERLRVAWGKPMKVGSASRCAIYNATVSTTGAAGPHTKRAIDFEVLGGEALALLALALSLKLFTGVGIHQRGPHGKRFLHVDDLPDELGQPRPWIWSY